MQFLALIMCYMLLHNWLHFRSTRQPFSPYQLIVLAYTADYTVFFWFSSSFHILELFYRLLFYLVRDFCILFCFVRDFCIFCSSLYMTFAALEMVTGLIFQVNWIAHMPSFLEELVPHNFEKIAYAGFSLSSNIFLIVSGYQQDKKFSKSV